MSDVDTCSEVSDRCPVSESLYGYRPNLPVNATLGVGFAIFAVLQLASLCCFRVRTWSFSITLAIGTILEVLGYGGRVIMNDNPFSTVGVSAQLIALIVAPSFVAAAISVTFKHIIVYCGAQYSWIRPRFIPWVMIGTDFLGIVIQFLGASMLAMEVTKDEPDPDKVDLGNNVIIFGVVFQAVIMALCGSYMLHFWHRIRRAHHHSSPSSTSTTRISSSSTPHLARKFRTFLYALSASFLAILIRCIYRCVEMISGWGSELMREEVAFLVLDGAMVFVAVVLLTVWQPGVWFEGMMRKGKKGARDGKREEVGGEEEGMEVPLYQQPQQQQPPPRYNPQQAYQGGQWSGVAPASASAPGEGEGEAQAYYDPPVVQRLGQGGYSRV